MSHKKLEDMKKSGSYDEICELKKDLVKIFASELHTKGVNDLDTKDCAEVADMIKDLAEAEKACMEACYYETIVKAMEKADEDDDDGRMGYNSRHYANGRFAPKGRGTRMGYMPDMMMQYPYIYGYINDPDFEDKMAERYGYQRNSGRNSQEGNRGGYQTSGAGNRSQSGSRMGYDDWDWDPDDDPKQSREYNEYKRAKRHYTESKSPADKQRMDEHAMKHMNQAIDSFREMWKDADPTMRKRMKTDLTALVGEMPT